MFAHTAAKFIGAVSTVVMVVTQLDGRDTASVGTRELIHTTGWTTGLT